MDETPQKETTVDQEKVFLGVSSPEKRIPKYCNGVFYAGLDQGIIMTFVTKEKTSERDENIVIERIFVDKDHAKKIAEQLLQLCSSDLNITP